MMTMINIILEDEGRGMRIRLRMTIRIDEEGEERDKDEDDIVNMAETELMHCGDGFCNGLGTLFSHFRVELSRGWGDQ